MGEPSSAVPWYYPFVMTAVTIPEVTLAFALFGAVAWFWLKSRRDVLASEPISRPDAGGRHARVSEDRGGLNGAP